MPQQAIAIKNLYVNLASANYKFQATYGTGGSSVGGIQTLNGSWSDDAPPDAQMVWAGSNPTFQNGDGVSRSVSGLRAGNNAGGAGELIVHIPHTGVTLEDGDTIVYTSVRVVFETPDMAA